MAGAVAAVGTGMLCPGRFLDLTTPTTTTELSSSVRGTSSSGCDSLGFGRFTGDSLRQHPSCRSVAQPRGVERSGTTSYASSGPRGKAFEVSDASTSRQLGSKSLSNLRGGQRWSGKGAGDVRRQCQQRIGVFQETGGREFELEEDRTRTLHVVADDGTEDNGFRTATAVLNQAWETLRQDVLYLDWRARNDVYAIKNAHDKVVEVLNPLARERKPASITRQQLADLQGELARAHTQVHILESRVEHSLKKLAEMEAGLTDDQLKRTRPDTRRPPQLVSQVSTVESTLETLEIESTVSASVAQESTSVITEESSVNIDRTVSKQLNVSGRLPPYPTWLKNFWYPVAFTKDFGKDTLVPIESFEETWVLFRGEDGLVGCIRDECAHRACPLSLGTVVDGRVQCPYHGWEYSTGGDCKKMPSVRPLKASVRALPCIEKDGMVWIWPGDEIPADSLPDLNPPKNFSVHAEIVLELPVEHGLLMENLLDLAHAPFTHTSTFAKGWPVPSFVKFRTPTAALSGNWDPYPIDMSFQPPCMVLSTIGLVQPGQLDGASTAACPKHLHQLHVCMPSTRGKTRLLYRMALDFAHWAKYVPFINKLWLHLANQVLNEDLRLVEGQQNRMERGANVWKTPVAYDKLGVRYRRWRNAVEAGNQRLPFEAYVKVVNDL